MDPSARGRRGSTAGRHGHRRQLVPDGVQRVTRGEGGRTGAGAKAIRRAPRLAAAHVAADAPPFELRQRSVDGPHPAQPTVTVSCGGDQPRRTAAALVRQRGCFCFLPRRPRPPRRAPWMPRRRPPETAPASTRRCRPRRTPPPAAAPPRAPPDARCGAPTARCPHPSGPPPPRPPRPRRPRRGHVGRCCAAAGGRRPPRGQRRVDRTASAATAQHARRGRRASHGDARHGGVDVSGSCPKAVGGGSGLQRPPSWLDAPPRSGRGRPRPSPQQAAWRCPRRPPAGRWWRRAHLHRLTSEVPWRSVSDGCGTERQKSSQRLRVAVVTARRARPGRHAVVIRPGHVGHGSGHVLGRADGTTGRRLRFGRGGSGTVPARRATGRLDRTASALRGDFSRASQVL